MVVSPCLPTIERCCFCTRNLRLACSLITIWAMLAICDSCKRVFHPTCKNQYHEDSALSAPLQSLKWPLFLTNIFTAISSFVLLIGVLFNTLRHSADVFICIGGIDAILMASFGCIAFVASFWSECFNTSDGMIHVINFFLWCYFILVVNSYLKEIERQ